MHRILCREEKMDLPINLKKTRNKLYIFLAAVGVLLYSIYCFAILPWYMNVGVNADIGLVQPVIPELIDFLGKIVEILAISIFCAVVVYGIYSFGIKNFLGGYLIFGGLCTYKYIANVAADWISSKYIPSDFWLDVIMALINAIIELVPFAVAFLIIRFIVKKRNVEPQIKVCCEREDKSFLQLFDPKDFTVAATMVCAATVLVTKLGGKIVNDVLLIIAAGLPADPKTYLYMLVNYSLSIIFAVFCYFVMLLAISFLDDRFKKELAHGE